ncbi:MAG: polysaccharide deacetylase [Ruminococcaceae bacterium]|nr:polysaccharide deacetylase [Oscillospiraceae bacterium]
MRKRIITIALFCAMLVSVVGCGDDEKKPAETASSSVTTEVTTTEMATTEETTTATETTPEPETTPVPETTPEPETTPVPETTPAPVVTTPRPSDYPQLSYTREELEAMDNTKHGWGQGVHVDALNRPTSCTSWQNKYGAYGAIYIMPETDPAYLTFDLGYEYGCTGRILDTLNAKGVKGTFFITMYYAKSAPDMVQRMVDEGHIVANHSVNHLSMPDLSVADMENEIMGLHNYVKENFGYEMFLFRPPMGEHSQRALAVAQNLGYKSVLWSYTYLDYDVNNQKPHAEALELCKRNAHKGAVYLLHGVSETNTAILGDLIDYLNSSGIGVKSTWD